MKRRPQAIKSFYFIQLRVCDLLVLQCLWWRTLAAGVSYTRWPALSILLCPLSCCPFSGQRWPWQRSVFMQIVFIIVKLLIIGLINRLGTHSSLFLCVGAIMFQIRKKYVMTGLMSAVYCARVWFEHSELLLLIKIKIMDYLKKFHLLLYYVVNIST